MTVTIHQSKRLSFFLGWEEASARPTKDKNATGVQRHVQSFKLFSWLVKKSFGQPNVKSIDLDLVCYAFDRNNQLVETVAPGDGNEINASASIYHSGDDESGEVGGLDEELSLELYKLPPEIESIIIYVRNDTDLEMSPATKACMRLVNMTDMETYFSKDIPFDQRKEAGYVFCSLKKNQESWDYRFIGEYTFEHPDDKENEFFATALTR